MVATGIVSELRFTIPVCLQELTSTSSESNSPGNTTAHSQILMINTHLGNGDTEIQPPAKTHLGEEDERNHSPLVSRCHDPKQRPKHNHQQHGSSQLPLPVTNLTTQSGEQERTKRNSETLRQREHHGILPLRAAVGVKLGGHVGPEDAGGVIEHVDDAEGNGRRGEVSSEGAAEDVRWGQGVWGSAEAFPEGKADEDEGADD